MPTSLKIAVLEDNDDLRELTVALLVKHGYKAVGAYDAEQLDRLMVTHHIDLLLLDLNLPGENGLSVAQRLKAALPELFIIMTSALGSVDERVVGYDHGADLYLPKPISEHELLAAVASIARRIVHKRDEVANEDLVFNEKSLELKGVRSINLTQMEAAILKQLATAENHKVNYFHLLERTNREVDARSKASLEVQIVNLRKKIAAAGYSKASIRAVRNEGYVLVCSIKIVR